MLLWLLVRLSSIMLFNATFNTISAIVAVSFIDGGNRNTRRKPRTCRKLLTNVVSSTPRHEWSSNSQL